MNLVKLALNSGMSDGEVVELLKIANGHLPRVKDEYDRVNAELYSRTAELNNTVQIYQQFVDSNIALKRREHELQASINELEGKKAELQKITTELQQQLSELRKNNPVTTKMNPEFKKEDIISTKDVLIPPLNAAVNCHPNEDEENNFRY